MLTVVLYETVKACGMYGSGWQNYYSDHISYIDSLFLITIMLQILRMKCSAVLYTLITVRMDGLQSIIGKSSGFE